MDEESEELIDTYLDFGFHLVELPKEEDNDDDCFDENDWTDDDDDYFGENDIPYSDWRDMPEMLEEVMCYLDNDRHSDE